MNIAVILAGGIGSRLGADVPKQFVEVLGKPVIAYTIEAFQNHDEIDIIEIVCLKSYIETIKEIVIEYNFSKVKWITKGGETYQHSVYNGIVNLKKHCNYDDIILLHWSAAPFIEYDIISDCIRVTKDKGNAVSTIPFFNAAGIKDNNEKTSTWIDRESIACMTSPRGFFYKFVFDLYEEAMSTGAIDEVEPHTHSLMYHFGKTIYFSKGNQTNIKITTKEDLSLFEGYLLMKEKRKQISEKEIQKCNKIKK